MAGKRQILGAHPGGDTGGTVPSSPALQPSLWALKNLLITRGLLGKKRMQCIIILKKLHPISFGGLGSASAHTQIKSWKQGGWKGPQQKGQNLQFKWDAWCCSALLHNELGCGKTNLGLKSHLGPFGIGNSRGFLGFFWFCFGFFVVCLFGLFVGFCLVFCFCFLFWFLGFFFA